MVLSIALPHVPGEALDLRRREHELIVTVGGWRRAIPRYDMNHFELKRQIAETSGRVPQLSFLGNWAGGVSIPDRIEAARIEAEKLAGQIAQS